MSELTLFPPNAEYVGWHRLGTGRKWRRISSAATESEAFRLMRERISRGGYFYVTRAGTDPNDKKGNR